MYIYIYIYMTEPIKKLYISSHGTIIKRNSNSTVFEVPSNIVFIKKTMGGFTTLTNKLKNDSHVQEFFNKTFFQRLNNTNHFIITEKGLESQYKFREQLSRVNGKKTYYNHQKNTMIRFVASNLTKFLGLCDVLLTFNKDFDSASNHTRDFKGGIYFKDGSDGEIQRYQPSLNADTNELILTPIGNNTETSECNCKLSDLLKYIMECEDFNIGSEETHIFGDMCLIFSLGVNSVNIATKDKLRELNIIEFNRQRDFTIQSLPEVANLFGITMEGTRSLHKNKLSHNDFFNQNFETIHHKDKSTFIQYCTNKGLSVQEEWQKLKDGDPNSLNGISRANLFPYVEQKYSKDIIYILKQIKNLKTGKIAPVLKNLLKNLEDGTKRIESILFFYIEYVKLGESTCIYLKEDLKTELNGNSQILKLLDFPKYFHLQYQSDDYYYYKDTSVKISINLNKRPYEVSYNVENESIFCKQDGSLYLYYVRSSNGISNICEFPSFLYIIENHILTSDGYEYKYFREYFELVFKLAFTKVDVKYYKCTRRCPIYDLSLSNRQRGSGQRTTPPTDQQPNDEQPTENLSTNVEIMTFREAVSGRTTENILQETKRLNKIEKTHIEINHIVTLLNNILLTNEEYNAIQLTKIDNSKSMFRKVEYVHVDISTGLCTSSIGFVDLNNFEEVSVRDNSLQGGLNLLNKYISSKKTGSKKTGTKKTGTKKTGTKKTGTKKTGTKKTSTKKTSTKKTGTKKTSTKKTGTKKIVKLISGRKRIIYTGSRGGHYYISKGKKVYISK